MRGFLSLMSSCLIAIRARVEDVERAGESGDSSAFCRRGRRDGCPTGTDTVKTQAGATRDVTDEGDRLLKNPTRTAFALSSVFCLAVDHDELVEAPQSYYRLPLSP